MVDPQKVVNYDDVVKSIKHPNKVIIDVRNPDEVSATGKIPSSINIPCKVFILLAQAVNLMIITKTKLLFLMLTIACVLTLTQLQ